MYGRLLLIILAGGLIFNAPSQAADMQVRYLTPETGLNNGAINSIAQDEQGFIWLATWDGITRYDGYEFRNYMPDVVNQLSLQARQVHEIRMDHWGRLWALTYQGVSRYNASLDRFERISVEGNDIYSHPYPHGDLVSAGGRVYMKSIDNLMVLEEGGDSPPDFRILDRGDLPTGSLLNIQEINDRLWVSYQDPSQGSTHYYSAHADESNSRLIYELEFTLDKLSGPLVPMSRNSFLVASEQEVGILYRSESGLQYEGLVENLGIEEMILCSNNQLWFSLNPGLGKYDLHSGHLEVFQYTTRESNLLLGNQINSLFEDFSGNLWIGHAGEGLSIANLRKKAFHTFRHEPGNPRSLSGNSVMCFQECDDGMLVGTDYHGLSYLYADTETGQMVFDRMEFPSGFYEPTNYESIWNIAREGSDRFWIASNFGLIESVKQGKNWQHRQHVISNDPTLRLRKATLDKIGNLWLGTYSGLILIPAYTRDEMIQHQYLPDPDNPSSLSDLTITEILIDSRDRMWIGTRDRGINLLSKPYSSLNLGTTEAPEMSFIRYIAGHSGNSLNNNEINCLFEYYDGTIWAGTQGGGINILDPETGGITYITEEDGLPGNDVFGILLDEQGNLWLSTNKGICSITTFGNERKITTYEPSDGIQGNVFMIMSYFKDSYDRLYFGGRKGFTRFQPTQIHPNEFPPRLALTSLHIFGKEISVGEVHRKKKILHKVLNETDTLTLSNRDYSFKIGVSALHFQNPGKNRIDYFLEGFDKTWNSMRAGEQFMSFSNLDPGRYNLRIKASNSDDIWAEEERTLHLHITPPWYRTWYGYSLFVLIFMAGIGFLFQMILRQQNLRHKINLDAARIESMKELNETKLRFFTNISHELRTPLNLVLAPIEYLYKFKETPQSVKEQLSLSLRNAKLLKRLINNIIEFRKYEADKIELKYQRCDLSDFIKQVGRNFETLQPNTDIQLLYHLYEEPAFSDFDPSKLEQVLYNLLSNAFKHTPEQGTILITLERTVDHLGAGGQGVESMHISIFNEGKNIPGDYLDKIFERFFHGEGGGEGSGIGLSVAKALVELHQGKIQARNIKNSGVEFKISFPRYTEQVHIEEPEALQLEKDVLGDPLLSVVRDSQPLTGEDGEKHKILIIEDNAELRSFYHTLFTTNYQFFEAADGDKGLQMVEEVNPDLVISDVMMPGKDGIEVCAHIKENLATSHIPVILLTAKGAPDQIVNGYSAGADEYVVKPFETEVLLSQVESLLKNRQRIREKYTSSNEFVDQLPLEPRSKDDYFMKTLNTELEENLFNEDYNVVALSKVLNISRNHLYRKVKALTGYSTVEYIRVYKLNKAAELLKTQKYSIKEVCYKTGFKDQSYFTKSFKNHFKQNPTEFIKSYLKAQ